MSAPLDEEPLDRFLNRPAARPVARMLLPLPVSANQVSMAAALFGVLAGVALALGTRWAAVAAVGLGWGAMVLDCADGQLARARGGGSRYGYLVDGAADYIIATGIHLGFIAAALSSPVGISLGPWVVVSGIVLCGVFMAIHSNAFESVKFRYRIALGDQPGEYLEKQRAILESLEKDRGIAAWISRVSFRAYFKSQRCLNRQAKEGGPVSRRAFLLSLSLGPTLRLAILLGSACAAAWRPEAIWIYPVYALVAANLLFAWVGVESHR